MVSVSFARPTVLPCQNEVWMSARSGLHCPRITASSSSVPACTPSIQSGGADPELQGPAGASSGSSPMPLGTAGVIISLSRIFTKLLLSDEKENTVIFFFISIGMELTCFVLHLLVKRTRFVRYYTACSRKGLPESHAAAYRVHHDVTAEDIRFVSQRRVPRWPPWSLSPLELSTAVPSPQENRQRGQPSSPRGSPGPEAELTGSGTYVRFDVPRPRIKRSWPSFRGERGLGGAGRASRAASSIWWAEGVIAGPGL